LSLLRKCLGHGSKNGVDGFEVFLGAGAHDENEAVIGRGFAETLWAEHHQAPPGADACERIGPHPLNADATSLGVMLDGGAERIDDVRLNPSGCEFHLADKAGLSSNSDAIDGRRNLLLRVKDAEVIDLFDLLCWSVAPHHRCHDSADHSTHGDLCGRA